MACLYAEHARELLGLGPEYHMASWTAVPMRNPTKLKVEMAKAPKLDDGRIAWKYAEDTRKVAFGLADHDAWVLDWERRTGKCHQCSAQNPGQEWIEWNANTGDRFRICPRCNGTNHAPHLSTQAMISACPQA